MKKKNRRKKLIKKFRTYDSKRHDGNYHEFHLRKKYEYPFNRKDFKDDKSETIGVAECDFESYLPKIFIREGETLKKTVELAAHELAHAYWPEEGETKIKDFGVKLADIIVKLGLINGKPSDIYKFNDRCRS